VKLHFGLHKKVSKQSKFELKNNNKNLIQLK